MRRSTMLSGWLITAAMAAGLARLGVPSGTSEAGNDRVEKAGFKKALSPSKIGANSWAKDTI